MADVRWPVIITTAILALALFFGFNYYRQRYLQEEPFLETLQRMESIAEASIVRDQGKDTLFITPGAGYREPLQDLVAEIHAQAEDFNQELPLKVEDRRNNRLASFALDVSPDLYEAARLGHYRAAAESITAAAEKHGLEDPLFTVDEKRLYLQARDGDYFLYLIIVLDEPEGGA